MGSGMGRFIARRLASMVFVLFAGSTLFLFLIVLLTGLACLPAWLRRRAAGPA